MEAERPCFSELYLVLSFQVVALFMLMERLSAQKYHFLLRLAFLLRNLNFWDTYLDLRISKCCLK